MIYEDVLFLFLNIVDFEYMNHAPKKFLIKVLLCETAFTLKKLIASFERQNTQRIDRKAIKSVKMLGWTIKRSTENFKCNICGREQDMILSLF